VPSSSLQVPEVPAARSASARQPLVQAVRWDPFDLQQNPAAAQAAHPRVCPRALRAAQLDPSKVCPRAAQQAELPAAERAGAAQVVAQAPTLDPKALPPQQ